jgi:hypothetical protein
VAWRKVRVRSHPAGPSGAVFAISLCLTVGLLLVTAGTALAISGFTSDEPAVRAQYPDATGLPQTGQAPAISNLEDVIRLTHSIDRRDPQVAAKLRAVTPAIRHKVKAALSTAPTLNTQQSGSIALLVIGIAVLAVGGVLRWRRGQMGG